jgi:hypothetical protein
MLLGDSVAAMIPAGNLDIRILRTVNDRGRASEEVERHDVG